MKKRNAPYIQYRKPPFGFVNHNNDNDDSIRVLLITWCLTGDKPLLEAMLTQFIVMC